MTPALLFDLTSPLAMSGWLALALSPLAPRLLLPYGAYVAPLILCLAYAIAAVLWLPGAEGGFDSHANVMALFAQPGPTTVGWIHFLAFDLLLGGWITRDARARGIRHWAVLPSLFLTLMLGPVGLLTYLAIRHFPFGKELTT